MSTERTPTEFIEQEHVLDRAPQVFVMASNAVAALADQEKIERKGGIRLTTAMKESVLSKIYDHKFKKAGDALDAKELRYSHKAMVAAFGEANLELLRKIGPPFAYTAHDLYGSALTGESLAEWRGTKISWRVGALGHRYALYVKDPLPMTVSHSRWGDKRFTVKAGKLADDIVQWHEDCQTWIKEKGEMQLKVNAVLNSVTTFASLQKTWPAGEKFWKHIPIDFPFRNQVPAVKVDELNDALGL